MFNVLFVVLGGLLLVLLVIGSIALSLGAAMAAKRDEVAGEVRAELGEAIVLLEPRALSFGRENPRGAMAGVGCLAVTAREIVFVRWSPRERLAIARDAVTAVERSGRHAGRASSSPLVRVAFGDDAIAWLVPDPDRLLAALV